MLRVQGRYEKALTAFRDRVVKELGDRVDSIVVYGSMAKGEAREESDVDMLIISDRKGEIRDRVFEIGYDIDLEHDVAMSLVFLGPEEVEQRVRVGSPFIEDILINGLILYDRDETFQGIRGRVLKASR
jgi:predicted nucleotidyltransferase